MKIFNADQAKCMYCILDLLYKRFGQDRGKKTEHLEETIKEMERKENIYYIYLIQTMYQLFFGG